MTRSTTRGSARPAGVAPDRTLTAVRAIAAVAGMPPNSGDDQVGQALADELAVGVVALADAHPVGDGRRQQALQGCQRGHRDRGQEQCVEVSPGDGGQRGRGQAARDVADRRGAPVERRSSPTVAATTAISEPGSSGRTRASSRISGDDRRRPSPAAPRPGSAAQALDGAGGQDQHLLGVHVDAEGGGHLLQGDDRRRCRR